MATLTEDDIEYIREMSGDTCGSEDEPDDYDVSPTFLQKLYDRAETELSDCLCADQKDVTVVFVLRARVAKAQRLYDEPGEGNAGSVKQKRDHLKEDLERWEKMCGMDQRKVTIGKFDTELDAECEDSEYASYPYRGYWPWMGN